jgi:hypothetical protein
MKYRHWRTTLDNGVPFRPLPFEGAVYTIVNGENIHLTGKTPGRLSKDYHGFLNLHYRVWFLTNRIVKRFGLYPIS